MKTCKKCNTPKEPIFFPKDKRYKDGHFTTCSVCVNSRRRDRYSKDETHRDKLKQRQKKYHEYANKNAKKHIDNLSDFYIIKELKRGTNLTTEDIKKVPELIELKRTLIKIKRQCRK